MNHAFYLKFLIRKFQFSYGEEIEVLKLRQKHGLHLCHPKESKIILIAKDVWDQIICNKALKEKYFSKHRVQTTFKSFKYGYLNLNPKMFKLDQK